MSSQNLAAIIIKAQSGNVDALAALIDAIARDLRAFIATYATSQVMVEETHAATWIQVRRDLNSCPSSSQALTWIRQRAITILQQQLDSECHAAIASRDGLRHLIAKDGSEGLQALLSPSNEGAAFINQRYAALAEALQTLVSRRYSDGATLSELARESQCGDEEIARRLFSARAGMHWRANTAAHANDLQPPEDPHLAIAMDQSLTQTLDATNKQAFNTTLMKDLGRAAAFVRQVRIDLMLRAIFAPFSKEQTRQLAGNLAKIENKRNNESSLLQVAAPPRAPIGSGSELRQSNERVAKRKIEPPSSAMVAAITMPAPRVGGSRHTASSDRTLLTRDRRGQTNNSHSLFIGIGVAVVGLIALIVLWSGNRQVITIDTVNSGNHTTAGSANESKRSSNPAGSPRSTKAEPGMASSKHFIRGINFGGPATSIDRHPWFSHRDALSAGLTLGAGTSIASPITINGSGLDYDRKNMLSSGISNSSGGAISVNQVMPDGAYELILWLANTSSLNEKQCEVSVNALPINISAAITKYDHWIQLGPVPIQVTNGKMELQLNGHGNARVAGMELFAPLGDAIALPAAIALTSPVDAEIFTTNDCVIFRVDVKGAIKSVIFFDGERRLGEVSEKPYSLTVDPLPAGDHRVIARATNLSGATSESLPLAFQVKQTFGTGTIGLERWNGITGNLVNDAINQAKIAAPADATGVLKKFSASEMNGENYYVRIRGYVLPPASGEYVFFVASDNEGELLLSSDASPDHAQRIAVCPISAGADDWSSNTSQQSKPVSLIAGQRYYIEMRYKNGGGPGFGACGWKLPNGTLERPIPGTHLSPLKP